MGQRLRGASVVVRSGGGGEQAAVEHIDAIAADAVATYASKRRRLAQLRAAATALRARVISRTAIGDEGSAAVTEAQLEVESVQAGVDALCVAVDHREASVLALRARISARRDVLLARRESLDVTAAALRVERNAWRNRQRSAAPPQMLGSKEAEELVVEKRAKVRELVREFSLCDDSIMGVGLPHDGNFVRDNIDSDTLEVGLCHTTRFLELAADYLCVSVPFTCEDIGFFWSEFEAGDGEQPRANGAGGDVDGDVGDRQLNIGIKAQQVNYNICAVFAADGMDVDTLTPELGSYFQTLPNLVVCTDPARNPALGTHRPRAEGRPFAQIIDVPVFEDFVSL